MFGIITTQICCEIARPQQADVSPGGQAVAQIRIEGHGIINVVSSAPAIIVAGADPSAEFVSFVVPNLSQLKSFWSVSANNFRDQYPAPLEFALAAMLSILNVLVLVPDSASSADIREIAAAVTSKLGSRVTRMPRGRPRLKPWPGSIAQNNEFLISHDPCARWEWKASVKK